MPQSFAHSFDPTILREYDIRGVYEKTLHVADARAVGRAFGTLVRRGGGKTVAVGRDGRLSSPILGPALIEGLTQAGVDVVDIGVCATPILYFAVYHLQVDGGVMLTGSHNPSDYNGFKMMLGKKPFFGQDIQKLGALAAAGDVESGKGGVRRQSVLDAYVERVVQGYDGAKPRNVVWDIGNGAVGVVIAQVAAKLPGKHIVLNEKVDGTFPAHHPDPTVPKNLEQLQREVVARGFDLGIAFDGDGDRIGVVDDKGRILWGDQFLVFLAQDVLKKYPGATIIADVKASQVLFDEVARAGGRPEMWKTGHSLIKTRMAETGAPLAGEMSGHIFYADGWYGFDDALYAGVRLLGVLGRSPRSLSQLRDGLPAVVNTPEMRFDCEEARKFAIVDKVRDHLAQQNADVSTVDGVRVNTADGWWLLRASNTQAVLVARCEARDEAGLQRLLQQLKEALRQAGVELPDNPSAGH
ncbi:MAG: phosphoglucomutase/phosphomannomutase PgmG [Reyranellaceae bacterium]